MNSSKELLNALKTVRHPIKNTDVVSAGAIETATLNGSSAVITLIIDASEAERMEPVRQACEQAALALPGVTRARAIMTASKAAQERPPSGAPAAAPPPQAKALKGVKKIIAVASGKGGVGKSTTAVNLAIALQNTGLKTALIDCDIYGPSASILLGVDAKPQFTDDDRIKPVMSDGLATMSMSYIVDPDTAAIWRGPMVIQAVQQFLTGVAWDEHGDIDIAVLDLPPGTGDVQLTLTQTVKIDGAVILSTPQDLSLVDARKAINMFNQTDVPILGIVENMSYFLCPHCGEPSDIFGDAGARKFSESRNIPFLGAIPLHMDVRAASDAGAPLTKVNRSHDIARIYDAIAAEILERTGASN